MRVVTRNWKGSARALNSDGGGLVSCGRLYPQVAGPWLPHRDPKGTKLSPCSFGGIVWIGGVESCRDN